MGPLVSQEQLERVTGYIDSGIARRRARPSSAATATASAGYFVEPTVFVDARAGHEDRSRRRSSARSSRRSRSRPARCSRSANDTVYGLAAGVWTQRHAQGPPHRRALHAGTVWVNCYNVFDAALPFGGYKQSGWGREMGHEVLNNYTETKAVCIAL